MARTVETAADIERQLRHEFSYLFDIDEDEIQLDTRIVDMPDFDILDWQAMASIVVDTFGTTLSDEDFYSLQTVGDVLNCVVRQRSNTAKMPP
jgi:acyl carrier protein